MAPNGVYTRIYHTNQDMELRPTESPAVSVSEQIPEAEAIWVFSSLKLKIQRWRILFIDLAEGSKNELAREPFDVSVTFCTTLSKCSSISWLITVLALPP